jgi:hypothetical protein
MSQHQMVMDVTVGFHHVIDERRFEGSKSGSNLCFYLILAQRARRVCDEGTDTGFNHVRLKVLKVK